MGTPDKESGLFRAHLATPGKTRGNGQKKNGKPDPKRNVRLRPPILSPKCESNVCGDFAASMTSAFDKNLLFFCPASPVLKSSGSPAIFETRFFTTCASRRICFFSARQISRAPAANVGREAGLTEEEDTDDDDQGGNNDGPRGDMKCAPVPIVGPGMQGCWG